MYGYEGILCILSIVLRDCICKYHDDDDDMTNAAEKSLWDVNMKYRDLYGSI